MSTETMPHTQPPSADERGVKILAKSVYKQLKQSGASRAEIVGFTNAMLELVTTEMRDSSAPHA
ncbi:MAG: hypothetical protein R3B40_01650 [Polyangiales bacterium]|nr:hypothetical protein [Sandaracinaceae bacterium]